jgi:hypothetical protein
MGALSPDTNNYLFTLIIHFVFMYSRTLGFMELMGTKVLILLLTLLLPMALWQSLSVHTSVLWKESGNSRNTSRSDSVHSQSTSQDDAYEFLMTRIGELHKKVANMTFESHIQKYADYDLSSKKALMDLTNYLYQQRRLGPLFPDLTEFSVDNKSIPNICLGIVTARRMNAPFAYLVQAVSSILNRMNHRDSLNDTFIQVFNVDNEPDLHTEVEIVRHFLPVTNVKKPLPANTTLASDVPIGRHTHENLDNAAILRLLHRQQCRLPIIVEDDALATNDWMDAVLNAQRQLEHPVQSLHLTESSWFMVRLFAARPNYPPTSSEGINSYDPTFSTVALLFNTYYLLQAADALEASVIKAIGVGEYSDTVPLETVPKDLVIQDLAKKQGARMLAYEPVIFQHTGIYSAVNIRSLEPYAVNQWIMFSQYFEAAGQPIQFDQRLWETHHDEPIIA